MDYEKLGLKVGLEVHQELETRHKLFCKCQPKLFRDEPEYTFVRSLRPSQSELGEVDPAALFEFMQGKTIHYEANRETSCLVEMDEEPPGSLNEEALEICLVVAMMTGSKPVDEVHVMRKTVVDGSNTSGFQRTCVVSIGGSLEVGGRRYGLQQICLEEDAARKIAEEGIISHYRIDRLGIPLIEVTTSPDINTPEKAEKIALYIGQILRATGRVLRGLGTIRQDLNVSIEGGALVEIKGVQELNLISKVIDYEVQRQNTLLEMAQELRLSGVKPNDLGEEYLDVSKVFGSTRSRIIRDALKQGHVILALKLPGFGGIIGREINPNRRLGTEMADRARFWGGVHGLFHTDELPGYDISIEEVHALKQKMKASKSDAILIVADEEEKCRRALSAVLVRAKEAIMGVPSETRSSDVDGTTHYTRPRPGAARMYPETDIVATSITLERLKKLEAELPEMPEKKIERIKSEYTVNEKLARQIVNSDYGELFEKIGKETEVSPTLIAVTLTETFKSLEREKVNVNNLSDVTIRSVFNVLDKGLMTKESVLEVFRWLASHPENSPEDALDALGLGLIHIDDLKRLVENKVCANREMVQRMGEKAFGPLMGMVMAEVRGRARVEDVQTLLIEAIKATPSDR